jgi:hypothetical protein
MAVRRHTAIRLAGEPTYRAAGEGVRDGEDRRTACPRCFFFIALHPVLFHWPASEVV